MTIKYFMTLLTVLLIGVYAPSIQAQPPKTGARQTKTDAHLTGHVLDASTGEHLAFATIGIRGTTIGTVGDASGHFLLKHLPVGKHTFTVSAPGYNSVERKVEILPHRTVEEKFELEQSVLDLDDVVVSGSRNEVNRRHAAGIVGVVGTKLFEKTASNNVAEVLNFQPGLRVEYSCSNCGVPQLRINGLSGQYSQVLLDSRPIFSSLAAVYGLEQLPAAMIERVEVVRGGGSALFGSNAIGGVVNIITKEPSRNAFSISNQTGIYQGGGVDVNTAINGSFVTDDYRGGLYVFGMIKDRSSYDRDEDGFSEIPKLQSETIGFRGYYKLSGRSRLTAEYHHMREFRRGGNMIERPPHEADVAEQLQHKIDGGGLTYNFATQDYKHRASVYVSAQNIDRNSYFGTAQNLDAYGTTSDLTLVGGGQYTLAMQKCLFMPSELTVGAEYSSNRLHDKMLGYHREILQNSISYGVFAQNEWRNDKLSLLIGGRLDKHNKVKDVIFSPRVSVRYTPLETIGLRASYSSGYRAPQAYDEDLHVAAVGGEVAIIELDPNLRPEYSQSVSASADLYKRWGDVQLNFLAEGFYTDLRDVFKLEEKGHDSQGNLILERRNASGAVIAGVNMELKAGFGEKVVFDGGFTIQTSRYKEPERWSQAVDPTRRMLRSPDHYGYLGLTYNPFRGFSASATGNYTGSMLVPHYGDGLDGGRPDSQTVTTPFWDLSLRVAYEIRLSSSLRLEISGGVKNVLDAFQSDLDRGSLRDSKYIYGPAAPRTYFVGAKFSI